MTDEEKDRAVRQRALEGLNQELKDRKGEFSRDFDAWAIAHPDLLPSVDTMSAVFRRMICPPGMFSPEAAAEIIRGVILEFEMALKMQVVTVRHSVVAEMALATKQ